MKRLLLSKRIIAMICTIFVALLVLITPSAFAADCNQPHQLPLLTHYDGAGYSLRGTDSKKDLLNPRVEEQYSGGESAPYWNNFFPSVDNYLAMNWDYNTYSDEQVVTMLTGVCQRTGVAYQLLQPAVELTTIPKSQDVVLPDKPYGQIVHSLVFGNNLFTVIVPPNWNVTKSYSLIINGGYGLNDNFIRGELAEIVARVYAENGVGAIGVLWNGGGGLASRTMNNKAYEDLNAFVSELIPVLGIDSHQVVAYGGSRGGVTALNIASHSAITSFKVRFVYAMVPPNDLALISSLAGPTYPDLMEASDWDTGFAGSWANTFRYPLDVSLTGPQAHVKVLTGTADDELLHAQFNLDSPVKIKNLLDRGTEVFLEIGGHDSLVPFVDQVRLMRAYNAAGVPTETRINYLIGHGSDRFNVESIVSVVKQISSTAPTEHLVVPGKIETFILTKSGSRPVLYTPAGEPLPLTVEIPRYMNENVDSFLVATGEPGKSYRLFFSFNGGFNTIPVAFRLDTAGTWVMKINTKDLPAGHYELVRIEETNSFGLPISTLKTIRSSLPMSENVVSDLVPGDVLQYGSRVEKIIKAGYYGVNDEFHLESSSGHVMVSNGVVEIR